jgi:hypothetical protein
MRNSDTRLGGESQLKRKLKRRNNLHEERGPMNRAANNKMPRI